MIIYVAALPSLDQSADPLAGEGTAPSDDEAFATLRDIRWADTGGEPYCPKCRCADLYTITTRKLWKCKGCASQFSVTSGTIFASRKLPIRDILAASPSS